MDNNALLKQVGKIVLSQRRKKGLTQEQLAEVSGLSNQTIANIEQGSNCKIESFVAVIQSLELSADFVLNVSHSQSALEIRCRHLSLPQQHFLCGTLDLLEQLEADKTNER